MSVLRLVLRELCHRRTDFLLALVAVTVAVTMFVGILTLSDGMRREIVRLMRNLGFNVLILPEDTDMALFWGDDYIGPDMDEELVRTLAKSNAWTVRHLEARLQERIQWQGMSVLLTGILPEIHVRHRQLISKKSKMGMDIKPGVAHVGHTIAERVGIENDQVLTIKDYSVTVARIMPRTGGKSDVRLYVHLRDAQKILDKPGRINMIEALNCKCTFVGPATPDEIRERVQNEIPEFLPGTKVELISDLAGARQKTRESMEQWTAALMPGLLAACGVWLAHLAMVNVRRRRAEVGILRAMGVGSARVAALFMLKAVVLGLFGALIGFALGTWGAMHIGPQLFGYTAGKLKPLYDLLWYSLLGAPLLCGLAGYLPTLLAVKQDPAEALREG